MALSFVEHETFTVNNPPVQLEILRQLDSNDMVCRVSFEKHVSFTQKLTESEWLLIQRLLYLRRVSVKAISPFDRLAPSDITK